MYNFRQVDRFGPYFSNVHILLGKIKNALDPNNLANPTRTINMEALEMMEEGQSTDARRGKAEP
jgi:hypothetical protein